MGEGRDSKGVELGTQNSHQNRISSIQSRSFHSCFLPSPRHPSESHFVVGLFVVCFLIYCIPFPTSMHYMNKKLKTYRRTYKEQLSWAPCFPNALFSLLFPLPVVLSISLQNVLVKKPDAGKD